MRCITALLSLQATHTIQRETKQATRHPRDLEPYAFLCSCSPLAFPNTYRQNVRSHEEWKLSVLPCTGQLSHSISTSGKSCHAIHRTNSAVRTSSARVSVTSGTTTAVRSCLCNDYCGTILVHPDRWSSYRISVLSHILGVTIHTF